MPLISQKTLKSKPAMQHGKSASIAMDADFDHDYQKYIPYLQSHCSDALKIFIKEKKFLYRGISEDASSQLGQVFIGHSPKNRKPLDSTLASQVELDQMLQKAGFIALRNNSIFCTSLDDSAIEYGTPYIIFPVNGFKYTWSTKLADLVVSQAKALVGLTSTIGELEELWRASASELFPLRGYDNIKNRIDNEMNLNFKTKYLKQYQFTLTLYNNFKIDLETYKKIENITNKREAIISWKKYMIEFLKLIDSMGYPFGGNHIVDIKQILPRISIKKSTVPSIKDLGFLQTNLATALKSQHEILIHGNYIAFEESEFYNFLTGALFGGKKNAR